MKKVRIPVKAKCDFCGEPAKYDSPTVYGYWAYLCEKCFQSYKGINAEMLGYIL